jgi:hypothetical protein
MVALLALPLALAACGGGGSGSSDPNSAKYDPAQTTLKAAGLDVCSEASETVIPSGLDNEPGMQAARAFYVANGDCNGQTKTANVVEVFQFDSKEAVQQGAAKIERVTPAGTSFAVGPLVVVTTGPNAKANSAAIDQQLKSAATPTTTSSS